LFHRIEEKIMRRLSLVFAVGIALLVSGSFILRAQTSGPYKVLKTAKVGGAGGFDYVYADSDGRRLYVVRGGQGGPGGRGPGAQAAPGGAPAAAPPASQPSPTPGRVSVYDLDTLALVGEIPDARNGHGAAVDPKSGHGFASTNPVIMWDTKTLTTIKTIDVQGNPDGIMFDPFNARVWIFSHRSPNATIINAVDGTIAGTMDLGGQPEQAVTDGKGHLYVDLEDKDSIAAVDAKTLTVTATYDVAGKCGGPGGLAFDVKNHILFASCHNPQNMVILSSDDGKILDALPIGNGTDGATFNPATMEAFSSQGDGTLTIIKENSPTSFAVEQNLTTMNRAKTLTLDSKTNHIVLIAAEYLPPPPPPAGAPPAGAPPGGGRFGGRGQMVPDSFTILVVGK
jgi:DNA-binding beta-propeller fold protein YncE